jgi:hypothetical protein
VQQEPTDALDPEIMGSLAAIGIVKGKPFNPDARMKKILTEAAAVGTATGRTLNWRARASEGFYYYPDSAWMNMLFVGGYSFDTPPPLVTKEGIKPFPPTGYRTLNPRTAMFYYATGITPAMIMRLTNIGSQYLGAFVDSKGEYFDGSKTYKVTLPPNIPAAAFWSIILYDNQTRSMLQTPQRFPRAGSQSYPSPEAVADPDGSTTVYFAPTKPAGVNDGNWIQTDPAKGWNTMASRRPTRHQVCNALFAQRNDNLCSRGPFSGSSLATDGSSGGAERDASVRADHRLYVRGDSQGVAAGKQRTARENGTAFVETMISVS